MCRCASHRPWHNADSYHILELDFDSLSLSEASPSASSSTAAPTQTASESDVITALRAQLSDSNAALDQLKSIIKDRLGESMGLGGSGEKDIKEEVIVRKDTKGKGVEGEERDDDSHYFEVRVC